MSFIDGDSLDQMSLLPACIDDCVASDALVRVVDAFVGGPDLAELGFGRVIAAATARPGYQPGDMLRLYIWGISIGFAHLGIWRRRASATWRPCG